MPTPENIEFEHDRYVGYLNDVDLFIEAMYDEKRNPNGIGKITLYVDSSSWLSGTRGGGMNEFYREIFGHTNEDDSGNYVVSSSYQKSSSSVNNIQNHVGNNITKTIKFIINDDIQFDGGNTWDTALDSLMTASRKVGYALPGLGGRMMEALGSMFGVSSGNLGKGLRAAMAAGEFAGGMSGVKLQTLMQTIKFWKGSNDPNFPLRFNMLATRPDMDIRRDLLSLYAAVYPVSITDAYQDAYQRGNLSISELFSGSFLSNLTKLIEGGTAAAVSGLMAAPLGYNPVDGYMSSCHPTTAEGSGLIDLRIGKWLHIPNLVMKTFSAKISKLTTRFGFPLYATCNLVLQPVRMWTITDIYDSFYSTAVTGQSGMKDGRDLSRKKRYYMGGVDEGKITKVRVGDMP